jgi:transaldolase
VAETLTQGVDEARRLFDELEGARVDYDDVVATLEREGIDKFSASFADLLEGVHDKARDLVTTVG